MPQRAGSRRRLAGGVTRKVACGLALAASLAAAHGQHAAAPDLGDGAVKRLEGLAGNDFNRKALYLSTGTVCTEGACEPLAQVLAQRALAAPAGVSARRVIQMDGPMTPERRRRIEQAGVRLGEYLPVNAFVADLSGATPESVAGLDFVRWNGAYENAWKVAPRIGTRAFQTVERQALAARNEVAVTIALFEGEDAAAARAAIEAVPGLKVMTSGDSGGVPVVTATLPKGNEARLADIAAVRFVEELPEATLRNSTTRWIVQSNMLNVTPMYAHGLRGEGQVLGLIDGRVSVSHCSFSDGNPIGPTHRKILAYNTTLGANNHGTHVAGTAVGDSDADPDLRGVAYKARFVFDDTPALASGQFLDKLNLHHEQGARIHTNSWGFDGMTEYNATTREIDVHSYANEDDLVIFAITNGAAVYTPENAKSVLAVAASKDTPNQGVHNNGGVGPTADGRRKPEVYAPGQNTLSANFSTPCDVLSFSGTSMAAPAVAGCALLLRQYFMEGFYPSGQPNPSDALTPTGALLRAMLINSSVDMTGIAGYPSLLEGWGRVLIDNSAYFLGDTRRLLVRDVRNAGGAGLHTDEEHLHPFEVTGGAEQLRVTLAFTDAPATLNAAFAPVNDIDLELIAPDGTHYRGNVFMGGASVADGQFDEGRGIVFDPLNSVEQAHVNAPETGLWQARIVGAQVNVGAQGYAIVITGQVAEVSPCPWDVTGDGQVNSSDLGVLLATWGVPGGQGDVTGDGQVNSSDLGALLASWGACP